MPNRSTSIYQAYGLTIASALPMVELPAASGPADLTIEFGAAEQPPLFISPNGSVWWNSPDDLFYHFETVGTFRVLAGRQIIIDPAPGVEERTLRLYLLGPVLCAALRQRGWLLLHASAVAIGGRVAAFMGNSGAGKSTMAAALHQRGHQLVADDYIAIFHPDSGAPHAYPGFPQLKLWPEAAASLGEDPAQMRDLLTGYAKRAWPVPAGFAHTALPMGRLYVLDEGDSISIEPVTGQQAMLEVVRHGFGTRAMHKLDPAGHFGRCSALLKVVPLRRLRRPRALGMLAGVAEAVEEEAGV